MGHPSGPYSPVALYAPLATADFANGVYSIGGASKTLDQMFGNADASWGGTRGSVTVGQGFVAAPSTQHNMSPTAELATALNWQTRGLTIVIDFTMTGATTTRLPALEFDIYDGPAFTDGASILAKFNDAGVAANDYVIVGNYIEAEDLRTSLADGAHVMAATFALNSMALSVDGSPGVSMPIGYDISTFDVAVLAVVNSAAGAGTSVVTCRSITFYPPTGADVLNRLT